MADRCATRIQDCGSKVSRVHDQTNPAAPCRSQPRPPRHCPCFLTPCFPALRAFARRLTRKICCTLIPEESGSPTAWGISSPSRSHACCGTKKEAGPVCEFGGPSHLRSGLPKRCQEDAYDTRREPHLRHYVRERATTQCSAGRVDLLCSEINNPP